MTDDRPLLLRIVAPHFVAGGEVRDKRKGGNRTAPILADMRRWSWWQIAAYCARQEWHCEVVR